MPTYVNSNDTTYIIEGVTFRKNKSVQVSFNVNTSLYPGLTLTNSNPPAITTIESGLILVGVDTQPSSTDYPEGTIYIQYAV